jgi:hypothetical protein
MIFDGCRGLEYRNGLCTNGLLLFVSSIQCLHSLLELKSKSTMNKEKLKVCEWVETVGAQF